MTIYDRTAELDALETATESSGHDLSVVYGRRRVGKTELLTEFCTSRPHICFRASQEAQHRQREKFVEKTAEVRRRFGCDRISHESGKLPCGSSHRFRQWSGAWDSPR